MGNVCGTADADPPSKAGTTATLAVKPVDIAPPTAAASPPPAPEIEAAKKEETKPATELTVTDSAPAAASHVAQEAKAEPVNTNIYVVYYSMYGHIRTLAEAMAAAANSVDGVKATIYQVPEILPADVLEKMHAPPKADHPILDPKQLPEADGLILGFPTRFGMMASQMKSFFDATGSLWQAGALSGKPATMFTSTGTQGGGQETTLWSAVTQLAHHGMLYVPPGYAAGAVMFGVENAKGGSPYGAGTLAGADGSRMPSEDEIEAAKSQAVYFAKVAQKLKA